ncbi:MAG: tetratricopeptide repeat protein [Anaeromyxobacteraceae bacterium]|nr:tetratricopeptide repeat protein [Anaeromyxobacteraceae bacterium]
MSRLVVDRLWPMLVGLVLLLAGALALQGYAGRRGNAEVRIVIQEGTPLTEEDSGEASPGAAGGEGPPRSERHARARILAKRAELEAALPLFEQELASSPEDAGLASEYGAWLAAAGQPERALPWLEKADRLRPTAQTALDLGALRARRGDRSGAEADLRRALRLRPGMSAARVALGALLLKKGETAEALSLLEAAAASGSNEDRARALVRLGGAHLTAGHRGQAEKAFEEAVNFAPARPDVRLGIARAWLSTDAKEDARRALPVLAKAQELAPDVPTVLAAVGRARERLGEDAAAADAYERALRLDPSYHYARRRLIRLALGSRDFARAQREAERLVADGPDAPEHHFLAALVADRSGRRDEARKAYRAAIGAARGDYPEAFLNLGVLERNAGDFARARAAYDAALRLRPAYPAAWLNIGMLEEARARPDEAERAYQKALELDPRHAGGWLQLGQLRSARGRWSEAEAALRRSLELRPGSTAALVSLGVVAARAGRLDAAVDAYRRALAIEPRLVSAHLDLALALERQGKPEEARAQVLKALEVDPGHVASLRVLAGLEEAAGRVQAARAALQELLDAVPGDRPARASLAVLLALEGDQAGCLAEARRLQAEAPTDAGLRDLPARCAAPPPRH